MQNRTRNALLFLSLLALSACGTFSGSDEKPLEGERISILELQTSLKPDQNIDVKELEGLTIPEPWVNKFWPQAGGYPNHTMQNIALNPEPLKRLWTYSIGKGTTDEIPLTVQPILVDGIIYSIDTEGSLQATDSKKGVTLWRSMWRKKVLSENEDEAVISGGISYANDVLYVTNGFNEILALAPDSGDVLWRRDLPAPSRAAPTVINGRVFVTTLNNRLLAFDANSSELLWEHSSLEESASVIGAASPAANQDIVVPAFSSGEIVALRVENGSVAWSDNLSNVRQFGSLEGITDIKAMPVLDLGVVYAMSFSGKLAAIDERTGTRIWEQDINGVNTPWIAGDYLFVISKDKQLIGLSRLSGKILWVTDLPALDDDPVQYVGPVMAGGRLIIISSDGVAIAFDPKTGKQTQQWSVYGSVTIPPIIANETMYILRENGTLSAWK